MDKISTEIVQDISLLYELSLSVGQSLDFHATSDKFLQTLISRKNLAFASIWLKSSYMMDKKGEGYQLAYAHPEQRVGSSQLPSDHGIVRRLEKEVSFSFQVDDKGSQEYIHEKDIEQGAYGIVRLGKIGFLKLYAY